MKDHRRIMLTLYLICELQFISRENEFEILEYINDLPTIKLRY